MYSALVAALLRWLIRQLNQGRVTRVEAFFAPDATFDFPGESSWSGRLRGRSEIREWLNRFAEAGLRLEIVDVMVAGPPWNLRVADAFRDRLVQPDGTVGYENEGMFYDRISWGRIVHHESHEDTEKVTEFDRHLGKS